MNLNKWNKPNSSEVRYYFDTKFGGCKYLSYSENAALRGRWIGSNAEGKAVSFVKTQFGTGSCRGEDGAHLDERLGYAGMTFEAFERLYASSLTASGNFSESRFFKNLELVEA